MLKRNSVLRFGCFKGELAEEEKQPTKSKLSELNSNRKLIIYRTVKDEKGEEKMIEELITRPEVIDAYLKIRRERDAGFIKNFVQSSQEYKEEKRREKRRLQDRLRRLKRNEMKVKQGGGASAIQKAPKKKEPKPPPPPKPSMLKVRCSACGAVGHMKTNRYCPLYGKAAPPPSNQFTMTDDQMEKEFSRVFDKEKGDLPRFLVDTS